MGNTVAEAVEKRAICLEGNDRRHQFICVAGVFASPMIFTHFDGKPQGSISLRYEATWRELVERATEEASWRAGGISHISADSSVKEAK